MQPLDPPNPSTPSAPARRRFALFAAGLALAVGVVFGPVVSFGFLTIDDTSYVTENPGVLGGLSFEGLRWALVSFHAWNWHPLTWICHQTDVELWGLAPGGHHLTSLALHALNAVLVALFVRALAGELVTALAVAALFALHPMRAESVAWIAERKDLLCAGFSLLALLAYLGWQRSGRRATGWLAVAGATILALAAKPMAVTLPLLFLLLDAWPLGRLSKGQREMWRALVEKLPFAAMAGGAAFLTYAAQRAGAVASLAELPFTQRLAAAAVAPVDYVARTLWPNALSVLYPHPYLPGGHPPTTLAIVLSAAGLLLVVGAALSGRLSPPAGFGVLFFLLTLIPVLGLVQVGEQATADRYTYLGHVGLFLALVELLRRLLEGRLGSDRARRALVAAVGLAVALEAVATARWLPAWSDTHELYARSVAATPDSPVLLWLLGRKELNAGRLDDAFAHVKRAIELRPVFAEAHHTLGVILERQGKPEAALRQYELSHDIFPAYRPARDDLERLRRREAGAAR